MFDVEDFQIRLKPGVERIAVLQAVRAVVSNSINLKECSFIASYMLNGERWCPTLDILREDPRTSSIASIADITFTKKPDMWEARRQEMAVIGKLIEDGAAGDAEAAIELCKGLKDGRYFSYFSAMG